MEKVKQTDLSTINEIVDKVFPQVSTSFSLAELFKLAAGVFQYEMGDTSGFPYELTDGMIGDVGSVVIPLGFVENVEELHKNAKRYISSTVVTSRQRNTDKGIL